MPQPDYVDAQSNSIVMGYSGSGITSDLRRVIEKEKLWDKHGVNVKAIYFNSGGVMTQAIAGGNQYLRLRPAGHAQSLRFGRDGS